MMQIFVLLFFLLTWPLGAQEQKKQAGQPNVRQEQAASAPAAEAAKPPERDPNNLTQYSYERYCAEHFYYLTNPERFVRFYEENFRGISRDVAWQIVQDKMLHKLTRAGCEW